MGKVLAFTAGFLTSALFWLIPGADCLLGIINDLIKVCKEKLPLKAFWQDKSLLYSRLSYIGMLTVCGVVFFTSVAIPIPGLSPLVGLGLAAMVKPILIAQGYSVVARMLGSFIGKLHDLEIQKEQQVQLNKRLTHSYIRKSLIESFMVGFFGEIGFNVSCQINKRFRSIAPLKFTRDILKSCTSMSSSNNSTIVVSNIMPLGSHHGSSAEPDPATSSQLAGNNVVHDLGAANEINVGSTTTLQP